MFYENLTNCTKIEFKNKNFNINSELNFRRNKTVFFHSSSLVIKDKVCKGVMILKGRKGMDKYITLYYNFLYIKYF